MTVTIKTLLKPLLKCNNFCILCVLKFLLSNRIQIELSRENSASDFGAEEERGNPEHSKSPKLKAQNK